MQPTTLFTLHPPKLAYTRVEAAKALGLSPITIDRLTKRGLLQPSRATRRPLYSAAEIERFLSATELATNFLISSGIIHKLQTQ